MSSVNSKASDPKLQRVSQIDADDPKPWRVGAESTQLPNGVHPIRRRKKAHLTEIKWAFVKLSRIISDYCGLAI